ncbi:hypothetical protein INT43_003896 [Umbelopsis isabellina]|uniref:Distal membrane-arm assembly complex protein 1-like domain-containing protein n=1 Tax=Mortierella isabellina TaxID=91625 RepID=A0A8H7PTV2_MORIS|nr:hypothetical protein INT43_003896 [Umbelopsis isabellina]
MSERSTEHLLFDKSALKVHGTTPVQPTTSVTLAEMSNAESTETPFSDTERKTTAAQGALAREGPEKPYQDCLPCKLTGFAAFSGIGLYAFNESRKMQKIPSRQGTAVGMGVTGVSYASVFLSAGVYRLML